MKAFRFVTSAVTNTQQLGGRLWEISALVTGHNLVLLRSAETTDVGVCFYFKESHGLYVSLVLRCFSERILLLKLFIPT